MPVWMCNVIRYAKKHLVGCSIFAFVVALSFATASRISFPGAVTDSGVSMRGMAPFTMLVFVFTLVCAFPLIAVLGSSAESFSFHSSNQIILGCLSNRKFVPFVALTLCVCWLPYFLACYPGGVFSDSFNAIRQAVWGGLNNQQPILYTLLLRFFMDASEATGHSLTVAIAGFCLAQYVAMAIEAAVVLGRLRSANAPIWAMAFTALFFAFFPLVPAYAVSIWKDVPFTLALVAFALSFYDASKALREKDTWCWHIAVRLAVSGLLVSFFRNNGKFILVLCLVILLLIVFFGRAQKNKGAVASLGALFLTSLLTFWIQGPVYSSLGVNDTETTESVAIPVQQIAAVLKADGSMTDEERAYIDSFLTAEDAEKYYNPALFDMIKWYAPSYCGAVIGSDMGKFITTWASIVRQNPSIAFDAYVLETCGFWAPNIATTDGYISVKSWYNEFGLENIDLLERMGVHGVGDAIQSLPPISAGIFALIMLTVLTVAFMNRNLDAILGVLPLLCLWLTVMIATPVAVSLRYVYALVFALPLEVYFLIDNRD